MDSNKNKQLIENIKQLILKKYSNKRFTIGDIYYELYANFDRSKFGTIRNIVVDLSRQNFLSFKIEIRGMPHLNSEKKINGAVYSLKK